MMSTQLFQVNAIILLSLIIQPCIAVTKSAQESISSTIDQVSIARGISISPSDFYSDATIELLSSSLFKAKLQLHSNGGAFSLWNNNLRVIEVEQGLFKVETTMQVNNLSFEEDLVSGQSDKQWKLFQQDITNPYREITGWTDNSSYQCGGIFMLGGYNNFAKGEVKKTFSFLPPHTTVRVLAQFHFIDKWLGEAAFMKLNSHLSDPTRLEYVWTQKYDSTKQSNDEHITSICGNEFPEYKLTESIDLFIPHNKDILTIAFGSSLETEDPSEASFGVSFIQIFIK